MGLEEGRRMVEPSGTVDAREDAFRDVFVPQDESPGSLGALAYADGLCVHFGAHLSGLMIGLVPYYPISLTASAAPEGWLRAQKQANEEASLAERRLRSTYAALAAPNDLKRVDAFEQEVGRICARRARTADMTIMGWSADEVGDIERAVFEACLFESGRPVLLAPQGAEFSAPPKRALVAWNGSREAARAVREARPLLRCSRLTRIVVVDAEDPDFGELEDGAEQLARHLARHGVAVEIKRAHSSGRDVASTLADEAEQFGAGVIVLGGYGHLRAGQWVYGGATRSALQSARTPLFFAN